MKDYQLRFRQIHLDFHTSEAITGIGAAFDPDEFAETLVKARVDSITCFARGHHGWLFYESERFPERVHPHLTRDLLAEQIEACHKRDIRVPIYITVQWDHYTANRHPEWLIVDENGQPVGTPLYEAGFYRRLCLNTPYVDWLKAQTLEVLETFDVDGIFFDIVDAFPCSCPWCREGMAAQGLEPSSLADREAYGQQVLDRFREAMSAFVWSHNPDCSIFYNAGHVGPRTRHAANTYSHFELESLPSGGWGYIHFPLTIRYARNLGLDCMGMTGKFHTSWGDFNSFKNQAALEFECFNMLAQGAKCSIGDQLPPDGQICPHVYDLVGAVYSQVEAKEPWCVDAEPVVDMGVMNPEEWTGERVPIAAMGAVRILQEGGHQFDILDTKSDLSAYKLVILPDVIPVDGALAAKVQRYLDEGGALLVTGRSGLTEAGDRFALDDLGVELVGDAPYSPDFLMTTGEIGRGLPPTEHVMYQRGLQVKAGAGAQVLMDTVVPYFNRTYKHFCSHRHTPSAGRVGYPGIVRKGQVIYFMHPVFTQYAQNAPRWCKQLVLNAVEALLPEPVLRLQGPSTRMATVNAQPAADRLVLHLLHYIPERRGQDFDVLEDVIPVYEIGVSLRAERPVAAVTCVPDGESLTFEQADGRVTFVVPAVRGHQMVAIRYA